MEDFRALANAYDLWIIEDASHAPGGYFIDSKNKVISNEIINVENLNFFSKFIIKFSDERPLLYGSFAIILAIVLGVLGATIRRLLSKYKNKFALTKKTGN